MILSASISYGNLSGGGYHRVESQPVDCSISFPSYDDTVNCSFLEREVQHVGMITNDSSLI